LALECAHRIDGKPPPSPEAFALMDRGPSLSRPRLVEPGVANDIAGDVVCDLLLSVHRRGADGSIGEVIELIWIVEVQLCRDISRAQGWSDAITAAARRFKIMP